VPSAKLAKATWLTVNPNLAMPGPCADHRMGVEFHSVGATEAVFIVSVGAIEAVSVVLAGSL